MESLTNKTLPLGIEGGISVDHGGINVEGMAVDVGLLVAVESIRVGIIDGKDVLGKIKGGSTVLDFVVQEIKDSNIINAKLVKTTLFFEYIAVSFLLLTTYYFFLLSSPSINLLNAPSGRSMGVVY